MKFSKLNIVSIVSWLQILGGIVGLAVIANLLLQTEIINGALLLIFLTGIGLFLFSIYAGKELFVDRNKKGFIVTMINQSLQLFQWNIMGYGISYCSGPEILIGIKGFALIFNVSLFSAFSMSIRSSNDSFISVNLVPVLIIILLVRSLNKIKQTISIIENE